MKYPNDGIIVALIVFGLLVGVLIGMAGTSIVLGSQINECNQRANLFQDSLVELADTTSDYLAADGRITLDLDKARALADEAQTHTCKEDGDK